MSNKDDCISRQMAIDLFPDDDLEYDTKGGYVAPHLARRMICELPFAQPETHWIPCDEKLPGNDERVLICGVRGGIAIARKAIGNPVFGEYAFWVQGNKIMVADAWMLLPDPYMKEGDQ